MRRAPLKKVPFVALVLTVAMLATFGISLSADRAPAAPAPARLVGPDIVGTAVAVSAAGWSSSSRVVIVSAPSWMDALAASSLGAPVLYTARDGLPGDVINEIKRLGAGEAVVIGGTAAIGTLPRNQLRGLGLRLTEVAGSDRYQTAAKIADLTPAGSEAIVASGETFADAAAIAPLAAAKHIPVFLAKRDNLPATSNRLTGAGHTLIVGGQSAVSDATVATLPNRQRLAGADRYVTSTVIADYERSVGMSGGNVTLAPGQGPQEAISGGVLAGKRNSVVLLAGAGHLALEAQNQLDRQALAINGLTAVGRGDQVGDTAIDDALAALQAADLVGWVNQARQARGLALLARSPQQDEKALAQVMAMMNQARLFHQQPSCATWGEAVGSGGVRQVFDAWMQSPGHRDVIYLNTAGTAGSAVATGPDGRRWVSLVVCG